MARFESSEGSRRAMRTFRRSSGVYLHDELMSGRQVNEVKIPNDTGDATSEYDMKLERDTRHSRTMQRSSREP